MIQRYIEAHIELENDNKEEVTRLIKMLKTVSLPSDFDRVRGLVDYLQIINRLRYSSIESLKKAWDKRAKGFSESSSCLKLYGDGLWAERIGELKAKRKRFLSISNGECKPSLLNTFVVLKAQISLITDDLDQKNIREALERFEALKESWRGDNEDNALYPDLGHLFDRIKEIESSQWIDQ